MTKPYWNSTLSLAARREGWDIWAVGEWDAPYALQKLDDPASCDDLGYENPVFDDDADAWVWVYLNSEGSPLHRQAMAHLKACSPVEYERIVRHVTD